MSEYSQILVEQADAVLTITLNRPEKLNAYTPTMMGELIRAVTAANDDPSIGAIVVTGAGRGFCAGADIEAVFSKNLDDAAEPTPAPAPAQEVRGTDWVLKTPAATLPLTPPEAEAAGWLLARREVDAQSLRAAHPAVDADALLTRLADAGALAAA